MVYGVFVSGVVILVLKQMAALDYNALRAQTLNSSREEEAVTVNTRALVLCPPYISNIEIHFRVANGCQWDNTD